MTKKNDGLVSTAAAAEVLGLTPERLRRLAAARGIKPDGTYPNPHYRSAPPGQLWSRRTVARLRRTKEYVRLLSGAGPRKVDWDAVVAKKYGSPGDAIPDAARAMFDLNRYTRDPSCSAANRKEIFTLKSRFVTMLYRAERFTDRVEALVRHLPAKPCFACNPDGDDYGVDDCIDSEYGHHLCERCGGTGMYSPAVDVTRYVFYFTIGAEKYCWIEPDHAIGFVPRVEATRKDEGHRAADADISLPRRRFAEAKALVRFASQHAPLR